MRFLKGFAIGMAVGGGGFVGATVFDNVFGSNFEALRNRSMATIGAGLVSAGVVSGIAASLSKK